MAADRGHGYAQMMLGRFLARGLGGEPDPAEARTWLEKAQAQGVQEAAVDLSRLAPKELIFSEKQPAAG